MAWLVLGVIVGGILGFCVDESIHFSYKNGGNRND